MKNSANFTAKEIARALKTAGYTAQQIAKALHDELNLSAAKIEQILKQIGYSVQAAANAVKSFAKNAAKTGGKIYKDVAQQKLF